MAAMEHIRQAELTEKVRSVRKPKSVVLTPRYLRVVDKRRMVEHKTHTQPTELPTLIAEIKADLLNHNLADGIVEGKLDRVGQLFGDLFAVLTGIDVGDLIGNVMDSQHVMQILDPDRDAVQAFFNEGVYFTVAVHDHPKPQHGFPCVYVFKAEDLATQRVITMDLAVTGAAKHIPFDPHFGMVLSVED